MSSDSDDIPGRPPRRAPSRPGKPGAKPAGRSGGRPAAAAEPAPGAPREERLARRLARAGVASRRVAEEIILAGRVSVNGRIVDTPALNVGPRDRVELDGQPLAEAEPPRMWRYHKPAGLVTTESDEKGRPTVFDRLPPEMGRVLSIGRLDLNSEGLLLLTNDGDLKRRLELPSTGWLRKYRVRVHGNPEEKDLEPLRRGVEIEGERFQPMEVKIDRQQGANAWLTVGIREGRNREVRRALGVVGFDVMRLIRVSYGPFLLGELAAGQVEEIRPKVLRDQLGLPAAEVERPAPRAAAGAGTAEGKPSGRPAPKSAPGKPAPRGAGAPAPKFAPKFAPKPGAKSGAKSDSGKPAGGRAFAGRGAAEARDRVPDEAEARPRGRAGAPSRGRPGASRDAAERDAEPRTFRGRAGKPDRDAAKPAGPSGRGGERPSRGPAGGERPSRGPAGGERPSRGPGGGGGRPAPSGPRGPGKPRGR